MAMLGPDRQDPGLGGTDVRDKEHNLCGTLWNKVVETQSKQLSE
jgi:hypothetical protein